MKPSGLGLGEIGPEDLVILNLDGQKLEGHRKPHNEIPIHSEIFRARPEAGCVIHIHPAFATAFGATGQELRPISHHGCRFWPGVAHYPTGELILTKEQGVQVASCLGDKDAVLMRNHGITVVGASVEDACLAAVYLEKACRLQLMLINYPNFAYSDDGEASYFRTFSSAPKRALSQWNYYLRKWGEENFEE
jgi:L-fuculose-phosphate aldolase